MFDTNTIAYVLGFFTTIIAILSMQFKSMTIVLFLQIISNFMLAIQYIIQGAISGTGIVALAIMQTVVCYIFNLKKRKFPNSLSFIFVLGYLTITVVTYKTIFDVFSFLALLVFVLSITQSESRLCRAFSLFNTLFWMIYDLGTGSYSAIITHASIFVFLIIGVIRLDIPEWKSYFSTLKRSNK